jgi:hypothetical protein
LACAVKNALNTEQLMRKSFVVALAAVSCALAAGAAQARSNVFWSIGINAAPIGVAVSNAPVYAPAPVYIEPAPVYVEPAPVYVEPAPVYVRPRVAYRPVPVVVGGYAGYGGYGRYCDERGVWHHNHRHDGRYDEYGARHDGGWQPVPHRRYPHD